MLRSVGYECVLPDALLRAELRHFGGLVLSPADLHRSMGYDMPFPLPEVGPRALRTADLFVDVKAHQTYHRIVSTWPNLQNRILWYRINGGRPEHVVNKHGDHGDEVSPPCPVLTPNQWYKDAPNAYTCWPPFARFGEYQRQRVAENYYSPKCLIHNLSGWGYGLLVEPLRGLGVKCYGTGSPDGLVQHDAVPLVLSQALCMVHLKSSDAPGYAIYECLAAACPLVCTRRLIWRCRMQDLLIPGETCLVFDRETHDGLTAQDVAECTAEVAGHLERLRDPGENRRIGENGRRRLREIMWSADRPEDVASLREFMGRMFS